jgi:hypothetical protein
MWERWACAHRLTKAEVKALIKQTEAALPYLRARGAEYHLARAATLRDLAGLKDYLEALSER